MKGNYKNVSCKLDYTTDRCRDCTFLINTCNILCKHFNFCVFKRTNGDIFDENIL